MPSYWFREAATGENPRQRVPLRCQPGDSKTISGNSCVGSILIAFFHASGAAFFGAWLSPASGWEVPFGRTLDLCRIL